SEVSGLVKQEFHRAASARPPSRGFGETSSPVTSACAYARHACRGTPRAGSYRGCYTAGSEGRKQHGQAAQDNERSSVRLQTCAPRPGEGFQVLPPAGLSLLGPSA